MGLTCTADTFDEHADGHLAKPCGKPATVLLTIAGADRAKGSRPASQPTPWNLDAEPRCTECAALDVRILLRHYPATATVQTQRISASA